MQRIARREPNMLSPRFRLTGRGPLALPARQRDGVFLSCAFVAKTGTSECLIGPPAIRLRRLPLTRTRGTGLLRAAGGWGLPYPINYRRNGGLTGPLRVNSMPMGGPDDRRRPRSG
jgi:hypothetical protein